MKIKVGIVGYGNLGKAVEEELLRNPKYKLVAIFSRRTVKSHRNTLVEPFDNYILYKNKIDIMLLCGSSKDDILSQAPMFAQYFDTINTFDTHAKIQHLTQTLNNVCKKSNTRAISCCGWDPGLFSVIRGLLFAISKEKPITFWGKGISMGHSDALRSIDGVIDAVEFTIPLAEAKKNAMLGKHINDTHLHLRDCYVYTDKDQNKIAEQIKNIPNYFKGEQTRISFVSGLNLIKLKKNLSHKGYIVSNFLTGKHKNKISFSVSMQSNPLFTARILVTYISAITKLKENNASGSFTPLDIPVSFLFSNTTYENLLNTIC